MEMWDYLTPVQKRKIKEMYGKMMTASEVKSKETEVDRSVDDDTMTQITGKSKWAYLTRKQRIRYG